MVALALANRVARLMACLWLSYFLTDAPPSDGDGPGVPNPEDFQSFDASLATTSVADLPQAASESAHVKTLPKLYNASNATDEAVRLISSAYGETADADMLLDQAFPLAISRIVSVRKDDYSVKNKARFSVASRVFSGDRSKSVIHFVMKTSLPAHPSGSRVNVPLSGGALERQLLGATFPVTVAFAESFVAATSSRPGICSFENDKRPTSSGFLTSFFDYVFMKAALAKGLPAISRNGPGERSSSGDRRFVFVNEFSSPVDCVLLRVDFAENRIPANSSSLVMHSFWNGRSSIFVEMWLFVCGYTTAKANVTKSLIEVSGNRPATYSSGNHGFPSLSEGARFLYGNVFTKLVRAHKPAWLTTLGIHGCSGDEFLASHQRGEFFNVSCQPRIMSSDLDLEQDFLRESLENKAVPMCRTTAFQEEMALGPRQTCIQSPSVLHIALTRRRNEINSIYGTASAAVNITTAINSYAWIGGNSDLRSQGSDSSLVASAFCWLPYPATDASACAPAAETRPHLSLVIDVFGLNSSSTVSTSGVGSSSPLEGSAPSDSAVQEEKRNLSQIVIRQDGGFDHERTRAGQLHSDQVATTLINPASVAHINPVLVDRSKRDKVQKAFDTLKSMFTLQMLAFDVVTTLILWGISRVFRQATWSLRRKSSPKEIPNSEESRCNGGSIERTLSVDLLQPDVEVADSKAKPIVTDRNDTLSMRSTAANSAPVRRVEAHLPAVVPIASASRREPPRTMVARIFGMTATFKFDGGSVMILGEQLPAASQAQIFNEYHTISALYEADNSFSLLKSHSNYRRQLHASHGSDVQKVDVVYSLTLDYYLRQYKVKSFVDQVLTFFDCVSREIIGERNDLRVTLSATADWKFGNAVPGRNEKKNAFALTFCADLSSQVSCISSWSDDTRAANLTLRGRPPSLPSRQSRMEESTAKIICKSIITYYQKPVQANQNLSLPIPLYASEANTNSGILAQHVQSASTADMDEQRSSREKRAAPSEPSTSDETRNALENRALEEDSPRSLDLTAVEKKYSIVERVKAASLGVQRKELTKPDRHVYTRQLLILHTTTAIANRKVCLYGTLKKAINVWPGKQSISSCVRMTNRERAAFF